jgi:hypothetical protein
MIQLRAKIAEERLCTANESNAIVDPHVPVLSNHESTIRSQKLRAAWVVPEQQKEW